MLQTNSDSLDKLSKHNLKAGFRVIRRYLLFYKRQITILSILGLLSAVGNGVIPYLLGKFFDSILSNLHVAFLGYLLPVYVLVFTLWVFFQIVTHILDWKINRMSELFSNTVWMDYLANSFGFLLELPLSFHKKNKIGEITTKINTAGNALETIIGRVIIDLAPQFLGIIIAIVIAVHVNMYLAAILIVGILTYILILLRSVAPLGDLSMKFWAKIDEAFGDAYDSVYNTQAVKQATAEKYEQDKIHAKMKGALPLYIQRSFIWSNLSLYQKLTILITQAAIFIVSVFYIRDGLMTLGELLSFNIYASLVFIPFVSLAHNWHSIQSGMVQLESAEKILATLPEAYEPKDAVKIDLRGSVVFKNVFFSYDRGKEVLSDISFEVRAGEVIALVGESGVGKSTLVDLISGYHFADMGDITIDGYDIKKLNLKVFRSQIAVVPQEVVLFNDTIKTNIKYGNFHATDEEIERAARKAHALDFIKKFPLEWDQVVGERGVKLSVGQKQRVAIARAILRNPKILILDEPTSALDAGSEQIIGESFKELMKDRTTFIIAHRLSTVRKANKILVFKNGKIIEVGTHQELLLIRDGEYKRLYELQIGFSE